MATTVRLTPVQSAVIGHVEWVQFARVERLPASGEIVHALEWWEEAAGGGAVAAVELARLGGEVTLFTALGDDDLGARARERLEDLGVRVLAGIRDGPQRRAFTFLDAVGERTITVMGDRMVPSGGDSLPWNELDGCAAAFFTGGDAGALAHARRAQALVATPRAGDVLLEAGTRLDALVGSGSDPGERLPRPPDPAPEVTVETLAAEGGHFERADGSAGDFPSASLPGAPKDAYGAGDCFAAGLTHALGRGERLEQALALAARCGAECLTRRGPYGGPATR
ncbi:MAG: PfkB family carbohydrate kinase [Thermoleophilaceae bacterium]